MGRSRLRWAGAVVAALAAALQSSPPAFAYHQWRPLFSFADAEIIESSGFAASSRSDRLFFTHNDSGDSARFFAVDSRGCTVARYSVGGADAVDWEDMTRGPGAAGRSTLWFGDIGDNARSRELITVYAVAEPRLPEIPRSGSCPEPRDARTRGARFDLVYPDGPHDAEALFAHPFTGRLYVVTKAYLPGEPTSVYAAPLRMSEAHAERGGSGGRSAPGPMIGGRPNRLTHVADLPIPETPVFTSDPAHALPTGIGGRELVTAADMAPDAKEVVVRTYTSAYVWSGTDRNLAASLGAQPRRFSLPGQPQGEAIAYRRSGRALLIASEDPFGERPPVYVSVSEQRRSRPPAG